MSETRKIKISVGHIEDAVISLLYSMRLVKDAADIKSVYLPIKSKDGLVEAVITVSERN